MVKPSTPLSVTIDSIILFVRPFDLLEQTFALIILSARIDFDFDCSFRSAIRIFGQTFALIILSARIDFASIFLFVRLSEFLDRLLL